MLKPVGVGVGVILLTFVLLFLMYAIFLCGIAFYPQSPLCLPPPVILDDQAVIPSTCRVRFLNTNMVPLPFVNNTKRKAVVAHGNGVFKDVDVVFFQEMFRLFDGQSAINDFLIAGVQGAVAETSLPSGKFTDSGLTAAAILPWQVKFVAFLPFSNSHGIDSWAYKGVAVFELYPSKLRFANTHMQASYSTKSSTLDRDDAVRIKQFREAVEFCLYYNVVLLGGDVNTSREGTLQTMSKIAYDLSYRKSAFVNHDDKPTCCKDKRRGKYNDPSEHLDNVWVLDTSKVAVLQCITNDAVSDTLSDHAGIDLVLQIK